MPEPTTSDTSWEPGSSEDYLGLVPNCVDGPEGDLEAWGEWLGCEATGLPGLGDGLLVCSIDTGHGPMNSILVDFFARSNTVDGNIGIAASIAGHEGFIEELCVPELETVPSFVFAPGYAIAIVDGTVTADDRYATAEDIQAASTRAARAQGLGSDADELPIEVLTC